MCLLAIGPAFWSEKQLRRRFRAGALLLSFSLLAAPLASSQTVAAGTNPFAIAVNPVTNKIYVANMGSTNVTVIDGATHATTTIPVGTNPRALAVNESTNKIYVANNGGSTVTVIDGATNATSAVSVGTRPYGLAVNPATNRVYVVNVGSNSVSVLDGSTDSVLATIPVGNFPDLLALDPNTNKIFVPSLNDNTLWIIDGATHSTSTVPMGSFPFAIAANPGTGKVYVANLYGASVMVYDEGSGNTTTVPAGTNPHVVVVNPATNKIYVANNASNNVTVIDGGSNATTTVATGAYPVGIAVVPASNKIYVANYNSGDVTVIDGATNAATGSVLAGASPIAVAYNAANNKIYVANNGSNNVTVIDGPPVPNPVPAITSLNPACVAGGSAGLTLQIVGSGFVSGSQVQVNGSARTTLYSGSSTALAFQVLASDVSAVGIASITVGNPSPGGGTSSAVSLRVVRSCTDTASTAPPVIQTPVSQSVNSSSAPAASSAPPCGNGSTAKGVWLTYTAPATGTLTADSEGSSYQAILAAYTGSPTNLTNVACNAAPAPSAAAGETVPPPGAKVQIPVTKGTLYYFLATAANGNGGNLQFNLNFLGGARIPNSNFLTHLPHLVVGGGYLTKITAVNMSGQANNLAINFLGADGTLQSSTTLLMQPGRTVRISEPESQRGQPANSQWVAVGADAAVTVNTFFEVTDQTAANNVINTIGFNDAAPTANFAVPVEFEPKPSTASVGRTVGLALANPSATDASVQLTLLDRNGSVAGTHAVPLAAYTKTAIDLSKSSLGSVLPGSNFIGTLNGSSTSPISVIALGDDFGPFFATPVLTASTRLIAPHIVAGGGFVTKLTIANRSPTTNSVTVTFYAQAGTQVSKTTYSMPAWGTMRIDTGEANRFGSSSTTWALITANGAVGVNLFFEFIDPATANTTMAVANTVGFNAAPEYSTFTIPVELEPPPPGRGVGRTMGLAMANANAASAHISLQLLDDWGTALASHSITLLPYGQTAIDLSSLTEFAAVLPPANFIGSLVVTSDVPVSAIALEDDFGPFSAVPVVKGRP